MALTFTRMTAQTLNALKGYPNPYPLDFIAAFDSTVVTRVAPGSVVHLNSSGNYVIGVGTANVMPLFTFFASDDPSVIQAYGDPSTDVGAAVMVYPAGGCLAIPATASYELVSTAYVAGSYPPNTPLTAATSGGNAGLLVGGTIGTDMIVGIVSRGVVDNGYGVAALAFWSHPIFHV